MNEKTNLEEKYGPIPVTVEDLKTRLQVAIEAWVQAKVETGKAYQAENLALMARQKADVSEKTAAQAYTKAQADYIAAAVKAA